MTLLKKILSRVVDAREFVKTYSQHLPRAFDAIFSMPCAVTLLRGQTPVSAGPVTVLYVGRRINYHYLVRTIFRDYEVVDTVHSTLLTFHKHQARLAETADVTIVDIGWPYHGWTNRRRDFLQLPDWINMAVELGDDWESIVRNFRHSARNNDLRLIRRNRYRCVPTKDAAEIEQFYDEMYLPFVRGRHDADAVSAPRRHVLRRARQGWLLKVLRDDNLVAAGVVYPEDDVLYFLWMGIAGAFVKSVPEAAISALYYFGIQHAFDHKFSAVDFTGTRAFLNDGAFRFKRKWGAIVEDTFSPSSILIKSQKSNDQAATFFGENPMLVRNDDQLEAKFVVMGGNVDRDTFLKLKKQYACVGVDTITVVEIGGSDSVTVTENVDANCRFRHVQCCLENFSVALVGISGETGPD